MVVDDQVLGEGKDVYLDLDERAACDQSRKDLPTPG